MLLTEMVELLSEHFNICNSTITNILQNNNIRINQRLLLEKEVIMNKQELKKTTKSNSNTIANNINEELETKVKETKVKETKVKETKVKETKVKVEEIKVQEIRVEEIRVEENKTNVEIKPVRGRGRPRKNTVMKEEEEEICVEVEEIDVDGVTYYKTCENVILSKDLEIEGIMRNGKIMKGVR
jgi:hypothetical protein